MIISEKYKYIFVGLPYSASSAISRELMDMYDGKALYHKHSNIPLLLKANSQLQLKNYLVFAVVRDPEAMMFSLYNKYLTNAYNTFTDPKYFIENGGFVNQKTRQFYKMFHANKWSFEDFLIEKFKYTPYNNNLSVNKQYLNTIIRFDNLIEDFNNVLIKAEITPVRNLPLYNKTKKIAPASEISTRVKSRAFGPFLSFNKAFFPDADIHSVSFSDMFRFQVFNLLKQRMVLKYDLKQMNNSFSIEDLKNER